MDTPDKTETKQATSEPAYTITGYVDGVPIKRYEQGVSGGQPRNGFVTCVPPGAKYPSRHAAIRMIPLRAHRLITDMQHAQKGVLSE